jgi:ribosomal protein S2
LPSEVAEGETIPAVALIVDIREALELINNTMEDMACGVGVKILNGIEAKRNRHAPVDQFASVIKQAMKEGRWSPGSNRQC